MWRECVSPPRFASLSLSILFLIALWWQDGCHRAGRRIHVRVRKVGKGSIVSLLCLFFIRNQSLSQNYPRSPQQTSLIFHRPEIELMFIFRSNTDKKGRGQHDWSKSKEPFLLLGGQTGVFRAEVLLLQGCCWAGNPKCLPERLKQ